MAKKLKFVIIGSVQAPLTGSVLRNRGIAKYLAREGHDVTYIEPTNPELSENVEIKGVNFVRTNYPSWPLKLGMFGAMINNLKLARKVENADYVFAMKSLPSSCIPALFLKNKKTKIILDIDDLEYAYWKNAKSASLLLKFFEKWVVRYFDFVTTHVEALKEYIVGELEVRKEKIIFLKQGLDLDKYINVKKSKKYDFKGRKILIYCAFLGVTVDLISIIKAYKDLKKEFPKLLLVIIGDGPRRKEYEEYCRKRDIEIVFTGYLRNREVLEVISRGDIAINYNKDKITNKFRSPIKLREYVILGKEVVSNNIGDTHLFSDYIYMSEDNLEDFKEKIREAVKRRGKKKSREGKKFVQKNYDWKKIIKRFIKDLR